jgi:hypothetical protein
MSGYAQKFPFFNIVIILPRGRPGQCKPLILKADIFARGTGILLKGAPAPGLGLSRGAFST